MAEKNKYLELDGADDFGFTFDDEADLSPITDEVDDLKERLQAIRKIYLPLLENLAKNPEQPIIKWPNREAVLKKQIAKLKQLTEV
jgi:hypothetical protein